MPDSRPTPFALALPDEDAARRGFLAIEEEARERGVDAATYDAFVQLGATALLLESLRTEEGGAGEPGGEADPGERFGAFLALLHHAHRHAAGASGGAVGGGVGGGTGEGRGDAAPLLLDASTEFARYLVVGAPTGALPRLPAPGGYLRLPRNLFWVRPGGASGPAEAVDGISWISRTLGRGGAEGGTLVTLLLVSGVLPGRPGFSVIPLPPLDLRDLEGWLDREAREGQPGADFETTLPGGELGVLHSLETPAEVVKLTARAFVAVLGLEGGAGEGDAGAPATDEDALEGFDAHFRRRRLTLGANDHAP